MLALKVRTLLLAFMVSGALVSMQIPAFGQASYTAQIRGVVTDQTGAVVANATITIINDATNISLTTHSDSKGQYVLTGLRPATYTIKAEGVVSSQWNKKT